MKFQSLRRFSLFSRLGCAAVVAFVAWLAADIWAIAAYWGEPQFSDASNYIAFASEAVAAGTWYPTAQQFMENAWIANTGYINFLALNLRLFGSLDFVGIEQLCFNVLLLASIYTLTRKFAGKTAACSAVILFCLMPSNILNTPAFMSDLLALSVLLSSFLLLKSDKLSLIFLSGLLAFLSNWIRPVCIIYWPALFVFALYMHTPLKKYVAYVCGIVLMSAGIAALSFNSCGNVLLGSTTKGTNMIMGCNDNADGGYSADVFSPGNAGYIDPAENLDAKQRDRLLTQRSVEWIINNPGTFIKLIPSKIYRLWGADHYNYKVLDGQSGSSAAMTILMSLAYYLTLLLAIAALCLFRREILGLVGIAALPVLLGTGMHLLMYGGLRYHYPMMPCVIFLASLAAARLARARISFHKHEIDSGDKAHKSSEVVPV